MIVTIILGSLFVATCGAAKTCETAGIDDTLCRLCDQRRGSLNPNAIRNLELRMRSNSARITALQTKLKKRELVAFYAYFGQNIPIGRLQRSKPLVYDKVGLNLGNGYDHKTGKFTAPSDGIYVFNIVTASYNKSWSTVQLIHNGSVKDVGFADSGDHNDRDTTTTITILSVKKGDVLYATVNSKGGSHYLESGVHARLSFSAFKIN